LVAKKTMENRRMMRLQILSTLHYYYFFHFVF
jgi:hypothetical protein